MNEKYKRSLKIVTLLLSAIIIATVSAATFSYMYIDGSVSIGSAKLIWEKASGADATIAGGTITLDLDVQPGIIQNFTEWVSLKNQDSANHNLTITVTTELSGTTFDSAKAYIYKNETGTLEYVDYLDLMVDNDQYSTYTGNTPLLAGTNYSFTFEIKAKEGTSGTVNFDIEVVYE